MQTVLHKKYGIGEVISKEVNENGTYIKARFSNGKEILLAIPRSFEMGVVEAVGSLKEEVDQAIADKNAREEESRREREAAMQTKVNTPAISKGVKKRWIPSCALSRAYEKYLIDNGYKIESDSGNPSTVFAYGNAVEKILETEGLSWSDLAKDIDNIVNIYGENGPKWAIGKKSNETYINALRRFQDMVHSQSY